MSNKIELTTVLGGVEDLLLDATTPDTVTQTRSGQSVEIHKINLDTIPATGKLGEAGFTSVRDFINEAVNMGDNIFVSTSNGGIGLVVGSGGLNWSGGTPASNEISLAQKLSNGTYRWLGKGTLGSDNWVFRGRVGGQNAVSPTDFVTKSQLDSVTVQSDWNQNSSSHPAYIRNKPSISTVPDATTTVKGKVERATEAEALAGTDNTRYVTPAHLQAFLEANPPTAEGGVLAHQGGLASPNKKSFPMPYTQSGVNGTGGRTYSADTCHRYTWFVAETGTYKFTKYNDTNSSEDIMMKIYKNGTNVFQSSSGTHVPSPSGTNFSVDVSLGDILGVYGFQFESGNNSNQDSYIKVEKIA